MNKIQILQDTDIVVLQNKIQSLIKSVQVQISAVIQSQSFDNISGLTVITITIIYYEF